MRINVFRIFLAAMIVFNLLTLINLQIFQGEKLRQLSDKNRIRLLPQNGARGKILDRNGSVIVGNKLSYDVMVSLENKEDLDNALNDIARITGVPKTQLRESIKKGAVSSFLPVTIIKNVDVKKAIALEELKTEHGGIIIQPQPLRDYPYGNLACHVLGYLDEIDRWRLTKLEDYGYNTRDIVGFGGIEERYDYYLRQEEGGLSFEVNNRGKFMRVLGIRPPKSGKDIELTIDLRIQKIVEEAISDRKGAIVVMDPYSGEIIAMVSRPGFDPGAMADKKNYAVTIVQDRTSPLFNRAISGAYPPGSVFKIVPAAAGLEKSKINRLTTYNCPGFLRVGNRNFACWNTHNSENLNLALAHSCDVFFYHTGLILGAQVLHDYALKFGLGRVTGIDIPYETAGFIPSPLWRKIYKMRGWYDGDTANFSIGQGDVLTTPLQMTRAIAVFANKGYLLTPFLVRAVDGQENPAARPGRINLHLKESTIAEIRKGLRSVVTDPSGTANLLNLSFIQVAGKTGTAQAAGGQPHAWFTGFFPYDKPKYAICVFLERGFSGQVSCILTKQILEAMNKEGLL